MKMYKYNKKTNCYRGANSKSCNIHQYSIHFLDFIEIYTNRKLC